MDKAVIAKVQSFGFDVYMRSEADSYLYFTDGQNIGYMQAERGGGFRINTVHKPSTANGTGYNVAEVEDFDAETLKKAFGFAPDWAFRRDTQGIVKWKGIADFLKANSWNGGFKIIGPVEKSAEPSERPGFNRFQKWAADYAGAYGFIVSPKGNWVELTKDGVTVECMSAQGVQAACDGKAA